MISDSEQVDIDLQFLRDNYDQLTPEEKAEADKLLADAMPEGLPEFYQLAYPDAEQYRHPEHLYQRGIDKEGNPALSLGETLEATLHTPQFASFSTPPQFGKTMFLLCAILWFAFWKTGSRNAYVSYNDDIALTKSDELRKMAKAIGIAVTGPKSCLTLPNGSQIVFTSVEGPLEGKPITGILALDDPYKSRLEAESAAMRKRVSDWFTSTALGRTHPSTSVLVVGHRWTVDDLIEELIPKGWPWSNYPALWPNGRSLWESFKSAAWLLKRQLQVGPFIWESEYQGNPTMKGGRLYEGVYYYTTEGALDGEARRIDPDEIAHILPPRHLLRIGIGVDFAYTEATASDWSIAVVIGEYDGWWYVLEVIRRQVKADVFAGELAALSIRYPGVQMRWDASSTERGTADIIRKFQKVPLFSVLAKGKPFNRAQLSSAAWRRGRILLPHPEVKALKSCRTWLPEFSRILTGFTAEASEDDDVAALASGFELVPARPVRVHHDPGTPEAIEEERKRMREQALVDVKKQLAQRARASRDPRSGWRPG